MDIDKNSRCKTPIVVLLFISLALNLYDFITYIAFYGRVMLPYALSILAIEIVPVILFTLYVLIFHKKRKATICVPITLGLVAIYPICRIIPLIMNGMNYDFTLLLFDLPFIISFILAMISAVKGFSNKIFIIIATGIGLYDNVRSTLGWFSNLKHYIGNRSFYMFIAGVAVALGAMCFYVAVLLFGLKNKIPTLLPGAPKSRMPSEEECQEPQADI